MGMAVSGKAWRRCCTSTLIVLLATSAVMSSAFGGTASRAASLAGSAPASGSPLQAYFRIVSPPVQVGVAKSFGSSLAISGDGSIALIGMPGGGAWVYNRAGGGWVLQQQLTTAGGYVALSSDGGTALVGGDCEHGNSVVLAFARSGSSWVQQGPALTPREAQDSKCGFGGTLALSADGNTALIGDASDAGGAGASWVFTRSGSTWSQVGPKLHPTDETGPGSFGASVSISGDGNTALIGAPQN